MARSHVPDDHIDLRHSAFFVEKAVLKEFRSGVDGCVLLFACNDVKVGNFLVHPLESMQILSVQTYLEGE